MRVFLLAMAMAISAFLGISAVQAADLPQSPPVVPEVDYGLQGSFYLRGSAGLNFLWAFQHIGTDGTDTLPPTGAGYVYLVGAGIGYETGTGLRFDGTFDYLSNDGLSDGTNTLHLRSGVALANVYYDFPISGSTGGSAAGGWGAYVGGGLGVAYNSTHVTPANGALPDGNTWSGAAAAMVGVTYDMGTWVADLGYRMIYIPTLTNGALNMPSYYLNGVTVNEIRGTVRYRFQ